MKIHPRACAVQKARIEFDQLLLDLEQRHQLSCGEIFSILGNAMTHYAKSLIQMERHPRNPNKKGDEA